MKNVFVTAPTLEEKIAKIKSYNLPEAREIENIAATIKAHKKANKKSSKNWKKRDANAAAAKSIENTPMMAASDYYAEESKKQLGSSMR